MDSKCRINLAIENSTFSGVVGRAKGRIGVEVGNDTDALLEVTICGVVILAREVSGFLADVMASFEHIEKSSRDVAVQNRVAGASILGRPVEISGRR